MPKTIEKYITPKFISLSDLIAKCLAEPYYNDTLQKIKTTYNILCN